jgi:hypothetical protein
VEHHLRAETALSKVVQEFVHSMFWAPNIDMDELMEVVEGVEESKDDESLTQVLQILQGAFKAIVQEDRDESEDDMSED